MKILYIFVDDVREPPSLDDSFVTVTCRTYETAIEAIKFFSDYRSKFMLDLDHDLGEGKTGYDICKFIVENQISILGYTLHTMNVVGRKNMEQLLTHYGYKNFDKVN